jgi:uncharacterized protein (TIGR03118 family)
MKAKTFGKHRDVTLMVSLIGAAGLLTVGAAPVSADPLFKQTNLVSDIPGLAAITDPSLVNSWGISESLGSPFWISDNGTGLSTLYAVPGATPPVTKQGLTVTIDPAVGAASAAPTGTVFNSSSGTGFSISGKKAIFLFDSEDGAISGWNPAFGTGSTAIVAVNHGSPDPSLNAVYKGLAISTVGGVSTLYATNFRAGTIEAYDSSFNPTLMGAGEFADPNLPKGYAPFNDEVINGELYVTYAKQDAAKHDDVAGLGNGFVDVFSLDGTVEKRLISRGNLDSPWGLAIAPSSFGSLSGDLLVGNFGNGMINAYDPTSGMFEGTLNGTDGNPLVIDGLWALTIGNGVAGGSPNTLYFTAGPDGESHGLFGALTVVPEPSTWAMMLVGFAGLGFLGYRRARKGHATLAV